MVIQIPISGLDKNFSYFVHDGEGKQIGIVDPGDVKNLEERIQSEGWIPLLIMLTHSHYDHVEGVAMLAAKYGLPVLMHKNAQGRFETGGAEVVLLEEGSEFEIGKLKVKVMYTPGHIDDAVCYLAGDDLLTGDTLFVEGCGRADLEGSNVEDLYRSLQRMKALPEETKVFPGHDYGSKPVSSIAWEKEHNKYLLANNFEEFRQIRMGY